jgi:hypothetical protein
VVSEGLSEAITPGEIGEYNVDPEGVAEAVAGRWFL